MANIKQQLHDVEKIVFTAALPYANGKIHIGHLLEYIYADISTRFLKLVGKDALYICASDMHGTPIVINARKAGVEPKDFAHAHSKEQQKDFKKFLIKFDNFHSTDSKENKELALLFFTTFKEKGYIYTKELEQLFDEKAGQFLPDRFIKGECPKCSAKDQYGDVCESCSATYDTTDLINPYSTITNTTPVPKKTTHYFFALSKCENFLRDWITDKKNPLQSESKNFVLKWLDDGLKDWCISRDAPYFGFKIPESLEETGAQKFFYVWLDAPIGYISSTFNYCHKHSKESKSNWEDYWKGTKAQPMHLIGKDLSYFHLVFWPVMLHLMDIELPIVTVHGFITVDGKKMSKSRGTFFTASDFFELYGAESLRFFYALHLSRTVEDVNLSFSDFKATTNNVLMANVGNYCFRTLSFAARNFPNGMEDVARGEVERNLIKEIKSLIKTIEEAYYEQDIKIALKTILQISDIGNSYFQKLEPWRKRLNQEEQEIVDSKVTFCVNLARNISILIKPILPEFSGKIEKSLSVESVVGKHGTGLHWKDMEFEWCGKVHAPKKLVEKIDKIPEQKEDVKLDTKKSKVKTKNKQEHEKHIAKKEISKDVFPLEIRVGKIVDIQNHPKADKLYLFKVDFGKTIGMKQIVAGLREFFSHKDLIENHALFLVNLKPAKIRGEESVGMTLTAESPDEQFLSILHVPKDVELGTQVHFTGFVSHNEEIDFKTFEKYPLTIKKSKVFWNDLQLKIDGKNVTTIDVPDGSKVK
jgi:methionyl-tRNA synthetase